MKNIGKITKFMVPAKFSSCLMYTDSINPSAASSVAPLTIARNSSGRCGQLSVTPKTSAISKNTVICNTDRQVPASSLNASSQPRGSGAVSSRRITPISRSYTMDSELCMPLNSATMASRPGTI